MSNYEAKCKNSLPIIFDDRMPVNNLTPKLVDRVNNNTEDLKNLYEETEALQEDVEEKVDAPLTPGTAGQVLTSDGEGGSVWASIVSGEIIVDPTLTIQGAAADAKKTGVEISYLKQDIGEKQGDYKEPLLVNMFDYFWTAGQEKLTSDTTDTNVDDKYLIISGNENGTILTVDSDSPVSLSQLLSPCGGIIEYNDGSVDLVSLLVNDNTLSVYPPLKHNVTNGKLYSLAVSIHLSKAGYKYYADCVYRTKKKYAIKQKAIAQYNPYASVGTPPMRKIGAYWWGFGQGNIGQGNRRVVENCTTNYLNMSFVTGATVQSPKGFEWEQELNGKTGYFEMYIGGRDTDATAPEFATGLEFTIEWYLDDALIQTIVKKTKKCEPVRFDFSRARKGKVKLTVTGGASTYEAYLSQATWWESSYTKDDTIMSKYAVLVMFMDSWGTYKNNEVQRELTALMSNGGWTPRIINNSLGGQTSDWGVANFYEKVYDENPLTMVTDFQINDITTGVTEATYIRNMKNLVNAGIDNGITPIVLLSGHNTPQGTFSRYTFPLITALTELSE